MTALSANVDWGAPGRVDRYEGVLVDPFTLTETGTVELDPGSSLSWSYNTENQLQGSLQLLEGDYRMGGYDQMVRIKHTVTIGQSSYTYTMGTLFVSNLSTRDIFTMRQRSLDCYGPLWRFTQDVLAQDFVRHKGDNVVQCIKDIIQYDGGKLTVGMGVDQSRVHTIDILFPVGENRAEVLRTYAGWINCEIMSGVDGDIVLRPYVYPQQQDPSFTFVNGQNCIYKAGVDWSTNRDEPTNRVVAYFSRESKQDDDQFPLSDSVFVDLPEAQDYSYEKSGRRRTQVLQVTEPCSHADLQAQAERYLYSCAASYLDITIEHAGVPGLMVGDCVEYQNGIDYRDNVMVQKCIVMEMSVSSLSPMCMTQTKLRII